MLVYSHATRAVAATARSIEKAAASHMSAKKLESLVQQDESTREPPLSFLSGELRFVYGNWRDVRIVHIKGILVSPQLHSKIEGLVALRIDALAPKK